MLKFWAIWTDTFFLTIAQNFKSSFRKDLSFYSIMFGMKTFIVGYIYFICKQKVIFNVGRGHGQHKKSAIVKKKSWQTQLTIALSHKLCRSLATKRQEKLLSLTGMFNLGFFLYNEILWWNMLWIFQLIKMILKKHVFSSVGLACPNIVGHKPLDHCLWSQYHHKFPHVIQSISYCPMLLFLAFRCSLLHYFTEIYDCFNFNNST